MSRNNEHLPKCIWFLPATYLHGGHRLPSQFYNGKRTFFATSIVLKYRVQPSFWLFKARNYKTSRYEAQIVWHTFFTYSTITGFVFQRSHLNHETVVITHHRDQQRIFLFFCILTFLFSVYRRPNFTSTRGPIRKKPSQACGFNHHTRSGQSVFFIGFSSIFHIFCGFLNIFWIKTKAGASRVTSSSCTTEHES